MMCALSELKWKKDVRLAPYSTYRIGGPAKLFLSLKTKQEAVDALTFCHKEQIPIYILGKGSNTLFADEGFNGAVLLNEIDFFEKDENIIYAGSGLSFPWLGFQTTKMELSGLEYAAGVPGSLGGAIYMNAGAMGQEIKNIVEEVEFLSMNGEIHNFTQEDLLFKYRWSCFHLTKGMILSAKLKLNPSKEAREKQKEHLYKRQASQPLKEASCGCVFRNLDCIPAGALIDELGLKGVSIGDAQISTTHANFIVNKGGAKAQDILSLVKLIEEKAAQKRGLKLQKEIRFIPYRKDGL